MQNVVDYNKTKVQNYYTIFQNHLNRYKTLFGGQALYWLDEVMGLVVRRYTDIPFVTAAIDSYQFLDVVYEDEVLIIESYVSRIGKRSIEIFAELSAFNHNTRETRLVGLCFSTFSVQKTVELTKKLTQLEFSDEVAKFVNNTYDDRKGNRLPISEFCKQYISYYNKKDINKI